MATDFANTLVEYGISVVVDGEPIQVLTTPETTERGGFERDNVIKKKIYHAPMALPAKVPDQLVDVDGVRWQVVSHTDSVPGVSVCLELLRNAG